MPGRNRGYRRQEKSSANFNSWLTSLDKNDIVVYTDGSQKVDKTGKILGTGSAWILRWKERWLGMNGFSLGPKAEVYDAEILGLCGGLEAALTSPMVGLISGIHICTDNLSVAQKAGSIPNGSSQARFARFKEAARHWVQHGRRITVQWVPSHMGIQGNEKADIEAKRHAETVLKAAIEETQTLAHARRVIRQKKDQAWLKEWETKGTSQAVKYYRELKIQPTTNVKVMPEMNLSRKVLGWLIAARSGHGHFADYHERFGHAEEDIRCKCGQRRSPEGRRSIKPKVELLFKCLSISYYNKNLPTFERIM